MANIDLLMQKIEESGMTITHLSDKTGILRATLYNRFKGVGDFTSTEIVAMTRVLKLTKAERDKIFLS